ncbi:MAG TPA: amino acid adenylation domain-containing protein, partial [Thermoanaerobaculia bacterium]|nr:amino acid adenylation domain-containing protein [Thermoanaerobaculia bacterium]
HPKRGRADNELTAFRYQVVLRVGEKQASAADVPWLDWQGEGLSLESLRRRLEDGGGLLGVRNVPNARAAFHGALASFLLRHDETARDVAELVGKAGEAAGGGAEPQDLWDLGHRLGWEVELGWSDPGPLGRFEAVFAHAGPVSLLLPEPVPPPEPQPWSVYASDPARGQFARHMGPELRDFLASRLPGYMVPSTIVPVDALPLTPNGKVDRRALAQLGPAADIARAERERFAAPRSATEQRLAALWADLLKVPHVGAEDDFFHLGGHSLLATQAVSRVRETFGVELPLRALFESPTVAGLAAVIDEAAEIWGPVPQSMVRVPRDQPLPPSFAQERLWFLDRFGTRTGAYYEAAAFRLEGRLDVAAFRWALDEIVRRHEALRTTFDEVDGRPVQRIAAACPFNLPLVDLSGMGPSLAEVHRLATDLARYPFDLARGPLFRGLLLRRADADHAVLFAFHHVIFDGWSVGIFLRELGALYTAGLAGKPSPLPSLPLQYADFAVWQRQWLQGEVLERQMGYWRRALADLPLLGLPTDHPRPAVPSSRGGTVHLSLGRELTRAVRDLGRRRGATPFMVLLAAFHALLQRYTGEDDVAVGTPIANRNRGEIEGLIGFFVNVLVLRGDLSGDPGFRALVDRAREVSLGAFAHQDLPFEKVVEKLQPERDLGRNPLYQVGFQVMNAPASGLEMPELTPAPLSSAEPAAKFDLSLSLTEGAEIAGMLDYDAILFERATAWRIAGHFRTLLAGAVADPSKRLSELPLLTPAEEHQLLAEWNDAAAEEGAAPFLDRFAAWARRTPEATALIFEDEQLTYGELARRVDELAAALRALGVGPEVLVGLCLEASVEILVAILAVWRAGGAYLPLDPSYPQERLDFMLADSGASLVLTDERLRSRLPEREGVRAICPSPPDPLSRPTSPLPGRGGDEDNLAYVIYTSGSTGRPKGVAVTRRGLGNLSQVHVSHFGVGPGSRVLQIASFSFDASVAKIVGALGTGAAMVLARHETWQPGPDLTAGLARHEVSFSVMVPSLVSALPPESPEELPALSFLATAGEACPVELVELWSPGRRFWNLYGPTELTVVCIGGKALPMGKPPDMGRPLPTFRAHVVDWHLRAVPVGVPGELLLQGMGLARCYFGRPELTAERFVPDPWSALWGEPGGRLYRSGDLVRRLPDGRLECLGRIDTLVKVRGFRIELGEIEAALARHPAVERAAVILRERRLVAFVVPRPGESPDASTLRDALRQRLPEPMVPEAVVFLDRLPLDPNGKVDRRALEGIVLERMEEASPAGGFVPPRTPIEEVLAGIWAEVLGIERVGAGDDFFALSGNSMLAAQVAWRVRQALGVELPLRRLFERATLAELAGEIEERSGWAMPPLPPIERLPRDRPLPASFYQELGWHLQGGPVGSLLNMPFALRARGPLDLGTLHAVLAEIVRRHELLRSVFMEIDGAVYVEARPAGEVLVPVIDLSALPEPRREELLLSLAFEDAAQPFDLSRAPGFRVQIVRLGEQDHALLSNLHHMISDGASFVIYRRELWTLYGAFVRGEPSPLPELPIQPTDFAVWQRRIEADFLGPQLAWWRERLAGRPPAQALPGDRPRPAVVGPEALSDLLVLPAELAQGLRSLARSTGCTLSMVLTAAVQVLLHRYTGEEDITVGGVFAGRDRPELNGLIGLFLNTLPLRADLSGSPSFRELLLQVRDVLLEAHAHQGVPLPLLLRELLPGQAPDRRLLFKVVLNVLDFGFAGPPPAIAGDTQGLSVEPFAGMKEWARYDLALDVNSMEDLLSCRFMAAADILTHEGLAHVQADFQTLLEQIVADPSTPIGQLLPEPRHR